MISTDYVPPSLPSLPPPDLLTGILGNPTFATYIYPLVLFLLGPALAYYAVYCSIGPIKSAARAALRGITRKEPRREHGSYLEMD